MAGGGPQAGAAPAAPLTQAALDGVVGAARARLQAAGVGGALLGRLAAAQFQVSDLPGRVYAWLKARQELAGGQDVIVGRREQACVNVYVRLL